MKNTFFSKKRLSQFADSYFHVIARLLLSCAAKVGIIFFVINRSFFEENITLYITFLVCIILYVLSTIFSYFFDYGEEARKSNIFGAVFWSITFVLLLANFILHIIQVV